MDFLFINTQELTALTGLPYIQQVAYLFGIKPYMDRKTLIVGVKRRISYQSLAEALYIEPHPGIQSGSPSRQQLRRVVSSLERAGLIEIQSVGKHLVLRCILANSNISVQNKPDTKPTHQLGTKQNSENLIKSEGFESVSEKTGTEQNEKADIPHNSENKNAFLCRNFEKFWASYPQPQNKHKTWEAFQKLNPDETLFAKMITALESQVNHYKQQQAAGLWIPNWKYPANWLAQQGWNDELITSNTPERNNAKHPTNTTRNSAFDIFWNSCNTGAEFDFDFDDTKQ